MWPSFTDFLPLLKGPRFVPHFLHCVDRVCLLLRELHTGWASSRHSVSHEAGGTIPNSSSGKGASRSFCGLSHLPVTFATRVHCSWYFVFLVKEEGKQEKGQMVQRGRNWHWKMWVGLVQTQSFGSVLPFCARGKGMPHRCGHKSSTVTTAQMH